MADRPRRRSLPFVLCLVLLAPGAVLLRVAPAALAKHYAKEAIDLRRSLEEFRAAELPGYRRVPREIDLQTTAYDLGTEQWFMIPIIETGAGPTETDLIFFVTYYSDPRDQVPHTPETCYRQAGALVTSLTDVRVPTPGLGPETPAIDVRQLHLDSQGIRQVLVYTFCCNGDFYSDRQAVRWRIGLPGERYTYFSKVEAVTRVPEGVDPEAQVERITRLLVEGVTLMQRDYYPRMPDE